jgi:8-oxo-dGTP pyrophosphatase MutT (NUDIX family)
MNKTLFFAQKAFIYHEGRVVGIQKSADDPNQPGRWEVPGGRMKFGEEVDEHLRREVREETRLEIVPGRPFYVWQWVLERMDEKGEPVLWQIVAVARLCTTTSLALNTKQQEVDDYIKNACWIPIKNLDQYGWIPNMVPVLAAFRQLPEIERSCQ